VDVVRIFENDRKSLNICAVQKIQHMENTAKNTRLIDLTVSQLESLLDSKLSKIIIPPIADKENQIGDYAFAEEITGYSRQRLYQLVSEGTIPYIKLPNGGVRFSRKDLLDWFAQYKKMSNDQIGEFASTLTLKREMKRKK